MTPGVEGQPNSTDTEPILEQRLRVGLWIVLGTLALFAIAEVLLDRRQLPILATVKVLQVGVVLAALAALRRPRDARHVVGVAWATVSALCVLLAVSNMARRDVATTAQLLSIMAIGTAIVFPWGVGAQLTVVAVAALALLANVCWVDPSLAVAAGHGTITVVILFAASVFIALEADRSRRAVAQRDLERRLAEDALRRSEQHFRSLIENALDLTSIVNADGTMRYASPSHQRVFGIAPEELVGANVFDLVHPTDLLRLRHRFIELVQNPGVASSIEARFRHADGSWRVLECGGVGLIDEASVPVVVVNSRDITERKRAQEQTAALLDLAEAMSGHLEWWEILDRVQRRTAEVLACDAVATFRWDAERGAFRITGQYGLTGASLHTAETLEFRNDTPEVERLKSIQTVVINDVDNQSWVSPDLLRAVGVKSLVWTQLHVRGRAVGALVAANTETPRDFDQGQVALFEGIARQTAVAMETAALYQAQQEEAEVSSALVRVGRTLIASLDRPVLLERLCQVTTEVLKCDCSHTALRLPDEDVYVGVSAYGYPPEHWETMRALKVPSALMADALTPLRGADVLQVAADSTATPLALLAQRVGLGAMLCMALRRGNELVGLHVACYRENRRSFGRQQQRIAGGIAQIASLALENARLVEELEGANRLKSDFVATMSHELRTPLNVIVGYNELLADEAFGPLAPEQHETLRRVRKSAQDLLDLINATLDLSRLEAGRVSLELRDLWLSDLLADLDAETLEQRRRPEVSFTWRVAPGVPALRTDALKLKVVLKNLVANAIKFTERGGISIEARVHEHGVQIAVADTGVGIAPETLPVIFEAFRQGDSSSTRRFGGTGLGLYIVRRLLDVLGGTVAVDSTLGRGSTFRVWLPAAPPSDAERIPVTVRASAAQPRG